MQLAQLVSERNVGFSFTRGAKADRSMQSPWQIAANDYSCRLTYQGRSMTLDYYQGRGIKRDPDAAGVLDNLLSDASSFDQSGSFHEWASDFGYDTTEPKSKKEAQKIYSAVRKQTERLKTLLGVDYEEFVTAER
jgi:hypothetical protein